MRTIPYIFLLFILISCSGKKTAQEEKAPVKETTSLTLTDLQLKQSELQIAPAGEQTLHETITVNGKVDVPPQSMISVSFPLGGYLKKTQLLPGMSVKKGEVIALIEDQSFVQLQQDYLVDKAKMEYLVADMQRQKELSENEATSKKTYQQVLSEYKVVQVMIKSLEEKLRIIGIEPEHLTVSKISRSVELRSPITGFVSKVNVNIGKYVNPSDVLFELVNPDDIHAALTVFEKDMPLIQKGMKAIVTLANNPAKKYEVEVLLSTKNIDETRSGLVHCHFENANHELLPGMFLTGSFQLAAKPTKVVPEEAVVRFEGKEYVFVVKDAHNFEMIPVKTGTRQGGMVTLSDVSTLEDLNQVKFVTKNSYRLLGMLKNKAE
ncbi:MAG TPA: efflux RND transporter periplasmic adaptor subunit [Sediminibacterium sp.]|nr:efflux RND transporter periplasmic adaptor subunit [Sediminibacterium sp.]